MRLTGTEVVAVDASANLLMLNIMLSHSYFLFNISIILIICLYFLYCILYSQRLASSRC